MNVDRCFRFLRERRVRARRPAPVATATRSRRKSRGQSLVELALVAPVLITMFAGAADLGRALTAYIELGSAAREGAAYGSQNQVTAVDTGGMVAAGEAAAPDIWGSTPTVSASSCVIINLGNPNCAGDAYGYSYVTVSASYTFTPILGGILGVGSITMTRDAEMRVVN